MESPQDPANDPGTRSCEPTTPGMDTPGSLDPRNKQDRNAGAIKRPNCSPASKAHEEGLRTCSGGPKQLLETAWRGWN
ncbi:unnamed protein product [Gadus morhua 'NCC']